MGSGNPIVFARFCFKQGQTTERQFGCKQVSLPEDEDNVAAGVASILEVRVRLIPPATFTGYYPLHHVHISVPTQFIMVSYRVYLYAPTCSSRPGATMPWLSVCALGNCLQLRSDMAQCVCVCTGQLPPGRALAWVAARHL